MAAPLALYLRHAFALTLLSLGLSACGAGSTQGTAPTSQTSELAPGSVSAHLDGRVGFYAGIGGS